MKKCPFCEKPCPNDHCAYKEEKETISVETTEESKVSPTEEE